MNFQDKINEYNLLNKEEKIQKVIFLISKIKDGDEYLTNIFNLLNELKMEEIDIQIVNEIYKVLLEAIIYQNNVLIKKNKIKIKKIEQKLENQLEQEKKEKEKEKLEIEKLLIF